MQLDKNMSSIETRVKLNLDVMAHFDFSKDPV